MRTDRLRARVGRRLYEIFLRRYRKVIGRVAAQVFFTDLVRHTDNFGAVTWLGNPIWQNVLDLWTIQETIAEVRPSLLIECGTNRGGSALFYAHLFDLMGSGSVLTIDIEDLSGPKHPRVTFLLGSSTDEAVLSAVRAAVENSAGPVMVILDSDHTESHVAKELECYAPLVSSGSFILVQDGLIDLLPMMQSARPGPLPAIVKFLDTHSDFEVDTSRNERFLITHHPQGWLRRRHE